MKGTEGIDYVITECSHCKGSGKCACYECLEPTAKRDIVRFHDDSDNELLKRKKAEIDTLKKKGFEMKCTVCKGVGKIVFWRE